MPPRQKARQAAAPARRPRHLYFAEHREAHGLSQVQLARRMDVSKWDVSRLESGERQATADKIVRYATALGLRPGQLFHPPGEDSVEDMVAALPDDLRDQLIGIISGLSRR